MHLIDSALRSDVFVAAVLVEGPLSPVCIVRRELAVRRSLTVGLRTEDRRLYIVQ